MPHDPEKYLLDMLDSCRFLLDFVQGREPQQLREDRPFRSAVERELQIIGEALIGLDRVRHDLAAQLPEYARIMRFRHVLVHGYDQVDSGLVWVILQDKLPLLEKKLAEMLEAKPWTE